MNTRPPCAEETARQKATPPREPRYASINDLMISETDRKFRWQRPAVNT